jgi:hypothetical protein
MTSRIFLALYIRIITLRVAIAQRKMQTTLVKMLIAMVRTATLLLVMYLELFNSKRKRTLNETEKEKLK